MQPATKRRIQLVLLAAMVVAAINLVVVFRRRSLPGTEPEQTQQASPLNPDYYVYPKKLRAYDLRSAKELAKQPVWVKEGYRYVYYPFDPARRRSNFEQEAGTLRPIEKLDVKDVVLDASPGSPAQKQVMAVFEKGGRSYAFPIGATQGGEYQIYADEILYIQDPRELYKHWPAEVWDAIARGEVKQGMSELQASFAVGWGVPQRSDNPAVRVVRYPRDGRPLLVIYRDGRAAEIQQSSG
jgi:hypothetical protein